MLDRSSTSAAVEGDMAGTSATRSAMASVSAESAHLPMLQDPGPRFPAKDGGRSLAEMAYSDLDAALQLLAERAQYITGANGAAIALRRGQHNDMLCRASVGSNAPELGALLSMEYGLSGESVRTHKALRCDDTERDPRVNREGCRQLGIASVVVMPIVTEQQVLGVFELFSGKPQAFEERDISALHRLSGMVETAVKHAVATQTLPAAEEPAYAEGQPPAAAGVVETAPVKSPVTGTLPDVVQAPPVGLPSPALKPTTTETKAAPAAKKPLFWSAAMQNQGGAGRTAEAGAEVSVPPMLRNLRKCQACGFPVSQGRAFCVECEERQWRGQRLSQAAAAGAATPKKVISAPLRAAGGATPSAASSPDILTVSNSALPADVSGSKNFALFASSPVDSQSWFGANKYVIGALLVVAVVIATIVWLR
ncbi:MAG: GAF domain-containing protein [Candidatus Sulfotelmatobacter sp.]